MVRPPFLEKGDTIAIVSTARKITKEELAPALTLCEMWGLQVILGKTIDSQENQFAGSDALRTQDFQDMLDDSSIKAIWCARGGYGTVRIIDGLDFSRFRAVPKWIIGYSDVTVLHSHIHVLGVETLHAQMPLDIEKRSQATRDSLYTVLFGKAYRISSSETSEHQKNGKSNGILVGGNLSILYSLCGSSSALTTNGKILFIEDLDEYLYHLDRMMQNLKRNDMLSNLAGLVVGAMSDMNDNAIPFGKTAEEIILGAVSEYNYPVCFNFPAGHVTDNRTLIMGSKVSLNVNASEISLNFNF